MVFILNIPKILFYPILQKMLSISSEFENILFF